MVICFCSRVKVISVSLTLHTFAGLENGIKSRSIRAQIHAEFKDIHLLSA